MSKLPQRLNLSPMHQDMAAAIALLESATWVKSGSNLNAHQLITQHSTQWDHYSEP
jgi:hypothetical protein